MPAISVRPWNLPPIDPRPSLLFQGPVQPLRQLPKRVRRFTQVLILFLQFFDPLLTFLQRVTGGFVGLHGLLSRSAARVQNTVPADQLHFVSQAENLGSEGAMSV